MRQDWQGLAAALRDQWRRTNSQAQPYHKGLFEGRYEAARLAMDAAPDELPARLYAFLAETIMGGQAE